MKVSQCIVLKLFMLPLDCAESRKMKQGLNKHKSFLIVEKVIFMYVLVSRNTILIFHHFYICH